MNRSSSLRSIRAPRPPISTSSTAIRSPLPWRVPERLPGCLTFRLQLAGGPLNGLHNVLVAGAPAAVAGDRPPDLVLRRVGVLLEERCGREHHAGRAEAALQAVLLVEPLLNRVQLTGEPETLHGRDLVAVGHHAEEGAGLDRQPFEQDRAGPAARRVAPDVRPSEAEDLPEQVAQEHP